jgi:hypothetical protein
MRWYASIDIFEGAHAADVIYLPGNLNVGDTLRPPDEHLNRAKAVADKLPLELLRELGTSPNMVHFC